jgi:hypothetical protein
MATKKGVNTFNYIRQNMSRNYQDVLPVATDENIMTISNILLNDAYQPMLNEFVNVLINRIALTIVRNKTYSNPLAILKKGSTPLGTDIQDIYENPAEAQPYEYSNDAMAQLLRIQDPDTHVAYYRRNRQDKYKKTISREGLQGAFISWEKFEDYISSITNSLYSGNYIDEFEYTKMLVDGAYDNNKVIIEKIDAPTDTASAKNVLKKLRALFNQMAFPSTEYNAYSKFSGAKGKIKTWTEKERIVLMIRSDVLAEIDVEALASAFNLDKADFLGRVLPVDKFANDAILGIICDESFFQIYDNIFRFDSFYNAETMSWQFYLHAWGTYAVCPFANAVVLATETPIEATSIKLSRTSINNVFVGDENVVTATLNPANATTNVIYKSQNTDVVRVVGEDKSVTIKAVGLGKTKVIATTDNGLTAEVSVNVTGVHTEALNFGATEITIEKNTPETLELVATPDDATEDVTFTVVNNEGGTHTEGDFKLTKVDNRSCTVEIITGGTYTVTAKSGTAEASLIVKSE